jgi:hypothetical protein
LGRKSRNHGGDGQRCDAGGTFNHDEEPSVITRSERRLLLAVSWLLAGVFAYLPLSMLPPSPPDLAQFYFAGQLIAAGQSSEIYNQDAYAPLVEALAATGKPISRFHFYNRPAFGALPWAAISALPYAAVEKLVVFANLFGILFLTWKLPNWFPSLRSFRPWLLCYPPFIWSVQFGQDTIFLTWAIAYSIVLMRRGSERRAGLLLSLCLVKPHIVWLIPCAFFFCKKRMTAYWFLTGGVLLAGISLLLITPAGLAQWRELLGAVTTDYEPHTMLTLRAIGLQTHPLFVLLSAIAVGVSFIRACRSAEIERALPIAIIASVILSPHAHIHDASTFAIAAGFSGMGALIGAVLLPWTVLMVLIADVAFPYTYALLGLAIIAYFVFVNRTADDDEASGVALGSS